MSLASETDMSFFSLSWSYYFILLMVKHSNGNSEGIYIYIYIYMRNWKKGKKNTLFYYDSNKSLTRAKELFGRCPFISAEAWIL